MCCYLLLVLAQSLAQMKSPHLSLMIGLLLIQLFGSKEAGLLRCTLNLVVLKKNIFVIIVPLLPTLTERKVNFLFSLIDWSRYR